MSDLLVVVGANGRTGVEIVREALSRGMNVRPIARDDKDTDQLGRVVDVNDISYATPDHPTSLPAVLAGARWVISCIDARTAGHGATEYRPHAAANIVQAAAQGGVDLTLHLSIMGAYRWSPSRLNRRSWHLDRWVRRSEHTWSLVRVSCYHDEILEAHVRPPDGGAAWPIRRSSRYAPISRRDVARALLGALPRLVPGRTVYLGGPRVWDGAELNALVREHQRRTGRRTRYGPLPPGDVSVSPDTTRVMVGHLPRDRFEDALAEYLRRPPPTAGEPSPVYARAAPDRHPADRGEDAAVLARAGQALRYTLHAQLVADLPAVGTPADRVTLDFRRARPGPRRATAHDGEIVQMDGVRVIGPDGEVAYVGAVDFIRDELADELICWWADPDERLPARVWDALDLGIRRRLAHDAYFRDDLRVRAFASK